MQIRFYGAGIDGKPSSSTLPKATDLSSLEDIVQAAIKNGTGIYDNEFVHLSTEYGDEFVTTYLTDVSTHMGDQIVNAFQYHDGDLDGDGVAESNPAYLLCADAFADVYRFLYPITTRKAIDAGMGESLALQYHDLIEDGVQTIKDVYNPDKTEEIEDAGFLRTVLSDTMIEKCVRQFMPSEYVNDTEDEQAHFVDEILAHDRWRDVEDAFNMVSNALELPYSHAKHKTAFYRYHTALNEADDLPTSDRFDKYLDDVYPIQFSVLDPFNVHNMLQVMSRTVEHHDRSSRVQNLEDATATHASQAVITEFEPFFSKENTPPHLSTDDILEIVARTYLGAVKSHDVHTEAEQEANRARMSALYLTALANKTDELYGLSDVATDNLRTVVEGTGMESTFDTLFS